MQTLTATIELNKKESDLALTAEFLRQCVASKYNANTRGQKVSEEKLDDIVRVTPAEAVGNDKAMEELNARLDEMNKKADEVSKELAESKKALAAAERKVTATEKKLEAAEKKAA